MPPVPVHIISGFLGTGKTTAIRRQLAERTHERVAVIVNDFGEAALDESALAEEGPFRITNIAGACVCCTAPEGFVAALGAVLAEEPDRLFIEPTGLARPQDLVDTIRRCVHSQSLELGPVVVLVDPRRLDVDDATERAALRDQVEGGDVLVANRTDLCSEAELARFDAFASELWPAPVAVARVAHGELASSLLAWPAGSGSRVPRAAAAGQRHADTTSGHAALSWRWPANETFSCPRVRAAVERMAGGEPGSALVRFKGVFRTGEGVLRLEWAGGSLHERPSAHRRDSRADAIFRGEAGAAAGELLEAARLTQAEQSAQANRIEIALPDGRQHLVDRAQLLDLPDAVPDVSELVAKRAGAAARLERLFARLELPLAGSAVVCAADGFASEPVPLAVLARALVLHSLEGGPLPDAQGGPFRLLFPDAVDAAPSGCANVKAMTRIVLRDG